MNHSSAVDAASKSKTRNQLGALTGLILLGLVVWAAGSCLASQMANGTGISPTQCNWYHRCRVEIRHWVSVINYLMTPEDDSGAAALASGINQPQPLLAQPPADWTGGAHEVSRANIVTNRPAPPRS